MFAALGGGLLAKLLSTLLGGIVEPLVKHYSNKDTQFSRIMVEALQAEAQVKVAAAEARIAMLGTRWGAFLLVLIVAPPALYMACVYGVTILESWAGLRLEVIALPARFESYAVDIIQVFLGGGSVVVAASAAARSWFKR